VGRRFAVSSLVGYVEVAGWSDSTPTNCWKGSDYRTSACEIPLSEFPNRSDFMLQTSSLRARISSRGGRLHELSFLAVSNLPVR